MNSYFNYHLSSFEDEQLVLGDNVSDYYIEPKHDDDDYYDDDDEENFKEIKFGPEEFQRILENNFDTWAQIPLETEAELEMCKKEEEYYDKLAEEFAMMVQRQKDNEELGIYEDLYSDSEFDVDDSYQY